MMVKIYELRDPRDEKKSPRYIGITSKKLSTRLKGHINETICVKTKTIVGREITHKNNWIWQLMLAGVTPEIHLIEEVEGWDYANEVEKYWIKEFKDQGYNLTNTTNGGKGWDGCKIPKEYVEKAAASRKGIPLSEEHKRKIGLSQKGKKLTEEDKAKKRLAALGRKPSKQCIEASILYKLHRKLSDETRLKISLKNKGKLKSDEAKLKMSKAKSSPVIVEKESGEILKFPSVGNCCKELNIPICTISRGLKRGYINKYNLKIKYDEKD